MRVDAGVTAKETTRQRFDRQVRELGGTLAYDKWLGVMCKPHKIICRKGHKGAPTPRNVNNGHGICLRCWYETPRTPVNNLRVAQAERLFKNSVVAFGGIVIGTFQKRKDGVACICPNGYKTRVSLANLVRATTFPCKLCTADKLSNVKPRRGDFYHEVHKRGGAVVGEYKSAAVKVTCVCPKGHECAPYPGNVLRGEGMCPKCAHREFTVVYVVRCPSTECVKFGITSGNSQLRLNQHYRAGYTEVVRLWTEVLEAYDIEQEIKKYLALLGHKPVRGREYFKGAALNGILDVCYDYGLISENSEVLQ